MFEKVWEGHEVGEGLLFIDLHLVHEVTSAQAFDGLRLAGRTLRRPDRTLATADHNVPTGPGEADELSRRQLEALARNCKEFGVPLYPLGHGRAVYFYSFIVALLLFSGGGIFSIHEGRSWA